jgi:hypothetical protein
MNASLPAVACASHSYNVLCVQARNIYIKQPQISLSNIQNIPYDQYEVRLGCINRLAGPHPMLGQYPVCHALPWALPNQ